MKNDDFQSYEGEERTPLLVSFLTHARNRGFYSQVSFDFFDAYVFDAEQSDFDPVVAVKQVKNVISKEQLERLIVDDTPTKVILVEGGRPDVESLLATNVFLSPAGVGVFIRGRGWLYAPRRASTEARKDVRLRLSNRWKQIEGVWRKQCNVCGEWRGENEFYDRPAAQRTARDPKRNSCISCFRDKRNSTRQ